VTWRVHWRCREGCSLLAFPCVSLTVERLVPSLHHQCTEKISICQEKKRGLSTPLICWLCMLRSERLKELVRRDRIHEVFECRPDISQGFESLFVQVFRVDPLEPVLHVSQEKSGEFRSWICVCHNVEDTSRFTKRVQEDSHDVCRFFCKPCGFC
jgi:hypothetical protein